MEVIPTDRPGKDCYLHMFGRSFKQQFITLLSSKEGSPIGFQTINYQYSPYIEQKQKERHDRATTVPLKETTIEKDIYFNTTSENRYMNKPPE